MRTQQLQVADGLRTFAVVLDDGEDPFEQLTAFAEDADVTGASCTGIGALRQATIGWFDPERRDYQRSTIDEQCEVLSLVGDIALDEGRPAVHAHIVLGRRDLSAVGGHLFGGRVWPTFEIVVTETPVALRKRMDPAVGLPLIDLTVSGGS